MYLLSIVFVFILVSNLLDVPLPSFINPGNWCWLITSVLFIIKGIGDVIPSEATDSKFVRSLLQLFKVKTNVTLKLDQLFIHFLNEFKPFLTKDERRDMIRDQQPGETLFDALEQSNFFKPMQLPIRRFTERRNCDLKCPDDSSPDDRNRFNVPERTTPIEYTGSCKVPMPEMGQSLEDCFIKDLKRVHVKERVCNHLTASGQSCKGIKWERSRQEVTGCPNAIVLALNRAYFEKENDGLTHKKYSTGRKDRHGKEIYILKELINRTPVKIDGYFHINVNKVRYELVAATQHIGNYLI